MNRQQVSLKIGDIEHTMRVKFSEGGDTDSHEVSAFLCAEIKKEITPALIEGLLSKSSMNTEPEVRLDAALLQEIIMPFAVVNAPTFVVDTDKGPTSFGCRSQNFNSVGDFNKLYRSECIALYSAKRVNEEEDYRAKGVHSIDAMRRQLGRGPRVYCAFEYAIMSEGQLTNIQDDYIPKKAS